MPARSLEFSPRPVVRRARQALAVIEAVEMEHTLHAPRRGVAEGLYGVGDQVAEGGELLRLESVP